MLTKIWLRTQKAKKPTSCKLIWYVSDLLFVLVLMSVSLALCLLHNGKTKQTQHAYTCKKVSTWHLAKVRLGGGEGGLDWVRYKKYSICVSFATRIKAIHLFSNKFAVRKRVWAKMQWIFLCVHLIVSGYMCWSWWWSQKVIVFIVIVAIVFSCRLSAVCIFAPPVFHRHLYSLPLLLDSRGMLFPYWHLELS